MGVEIEYYSHGRTRYRKLGEPPYEPPPKVPQPWHTWAWRVARLLLIIVGWVIVYLHPTREALWGMLALGMLAAGVYMWLKQA